ncbi:hypothetical protein CPB86DRAFT_792369 [Serendipita vermifera]|nr:hypothetical protein CPB86DRAFT_792369 [Serendipita vermifera]
MRCILSPCALRCALLACVVFCRPAFRPVAMRLAEPVVVRVQLGTYAFRAVGLGTTVSLEDPLLISSNRMAI